MLVQNSVSINAETVKEGKEEILNKIVPINGAKIGSIRIEIQKGFEADVSPKKIAKKILKHFEGLNKESLNDAFDRVKNNITSKNPEVKPNYIEKVIAKVINMLDGRDLEDEIEAVVADGEVTSTKIPTIINTKKKEEEAKEEAVEEVYSNSKVRDTVFERTGVSTFFSNLAFKLKTIR